MIFRRARLPLLVLCGLGVVAFAQEVVSIGSVLADTQSYHLKDVVLRGKARNIVELSPYRTGIMLCWGTYTFTLEDGTGSIGVSVQGPCTMNIMDPNVKPDQVTDGEEVTVQGLIFVGDYNNGQYVPDGKATLLSKRFIK